MKTISDFEKTDTFVLKTYEDCQDLADIFKVYGNDVVGLCRNPSIHKDGEYMIRVSKRGGAVDILVQTNDGEKLEEVWRSDR